MSSCSAAGFSTSAAVILMLIVVVGSLPTFACITSVVGAPTMLFVFIPAVAFDHVVADMLLLSSLLLLVTDLACVTAVDCIPAVAGIAAIAGVPLVPDVHRLSCSCWRPCCC